MEKKTSGEDLAAAAKIAPTTELEGATAEQNRIDFNDPTLTGAEAVAKNLAEQG